MAAVRGLRPAALLMSLLAGCSTTPAALPTPAAPETTSFAVGPLAAVMSGENGMELRKWIVPDDPETIVDVLSRFTVPFDDDVVRWELERNGYQLLRLRAEDVESLRAAFGDAVSDLRSWQGQAPAWREVVRRGARSPIAAFVDGRVRVFEDGALRLVMRSWSLPTEDGVLMQLEIVSEFEPAPRGVLRDLVRDGEPTATRLPPGTIELQCVDGDAWVLTSTGVGDDPSSFGPAPEDAMGPAAAPPQTVGEILLRTEMPATRTIVVFVPRLPVGSVRRVEEPSAPRSIDEGELEAAEGDEAATDAARSTQPSTTAPVAAPAPNPRPRGFGN